MTVKHRLVNTYHQLIQKSFTLLTPLVHDEKGKCHGPQDYIPILWQGLTIQTLCSLHAVRSAQKGEKEEEVFINSPPLKVNIIRALLFLPPLYVSICLPDSQLKRSYKS